MVSQEQKLIQNLLTDLILKKAIGNLCSIGRRRFGKMASLLL